MKRLFSITLLLIARAFCLSGQPLEVEQNGHLTIGRETLLNSKINGIVSIDSIIDGGSDFDVLSAFGKPIKIDRKSVEGVGEIIDFVFPGLKLRYSALSQPEFLLQAITFGEGSELVLDQHYKLTVGGSLSSLVAEVDQEKILTLKTDQVNISSSHSSEWIKVIQQDQLIKELIFYAGNED